MKFFLSFFFTLFLFFYNADFCKSQPPCQFRVAGFDETKPLKNGISLLRKGKTWGFADSTGTVIITPKYDIAEQFKEGLALVGVFNKQRGDTISYYDTQLDQDITEIRYPTAYEFINKKGKTILQLSDYDDVHSFSDSLAAVGKYIKDAGRKTMTYGFIRHNGTFAVPLQYNAVGDVFGSVFSFRKDDRTGFINIKGDTVVEAIYDVVKPFSCGLSLVLCHNGKYNYLHARAWGYIE